ncbi:hypothetical protein IQ226_17025 [Dolichospermum sp. LEGE 00240]|jgi:hypothetical protein|uniref:hypothetical protein n=1 Tax=Dolichospermum sp. LEGE 00240 TaxID=1828603 RepID=UPI00187DEF91|nr:hypothetical protein [Dolichospermum sp. LEGE 00240]MDM3845865.1 hypothetical protein [Aphanizomenon gracile PMC638.10]MDM3848592.1 hypothetical protein [Aphanizomenon gracile PMC627.10]MDM3856788.1 hypothetical protein [Aphanizomenon gracile PMC649.10]MDM3860090.1 hypothetical protein [Aphanizomenon gracile PMC644.10]MBE9250803.1 hypothetical protein [Dolichospermum sp. LEGE 00240]
MTKNKATLSAIAIPVSCDFQAIASAIRNYRLIRDGLYSLGAPTGTFGYFCTLDL